MIWMVQECLKDIQSRMCHSPECTTSHSKDMCSPSTFCYYNI